MNAIFGGMFLKLAAWATKQALGSKQGAQALAHAAPVLSVVSAAAGQAGAVAINKAAQTNGNLAAATASPEGTEGD